MADLFWNNVLVNLPLNSNASVDASPNNNPITYTGSPGFLGYYTYFYSGSGATVTLPEPFPLSGDYTIELTFSITNNSCTILNVRPDIGLGFRVAIDSSNQLVFSKIDSDDNISSTLLTSAPLSTVPTWSRIAIVNDATSLRLYLDGTLVTSSTTTSFTGIFPTLSLANGTGVTTTPFIGYLDNVRITSAARYTSNYTPYTLGDEFEVGGAIPPVVLTPYNLSFASSNVNLKYNLLSVNPHSVVITPYEVNVLKDYTLLPLTSNLPVIGNPITLTANILVLIGNNIPILPNDINVNRSIISTLDIANIPFSSPDLNLILSKYLNLSNGSLLIDSSTVDFRLQTLVSLTQSNIPITFNDSNILQSSIQLSSSNISLNASLVNIDLARNTVLVSSTIPINSTSINNLRTYVVSLTPSNLNITTNNINILSLTHLVMELLPSTCSINSLPINIILPVKDINISNVRLFIINGN